LSHEPTIELVARARGGDMPAMEALLQRCLPPLKRWAHGRLPAAARGRLDTGDLVQEAALHVLGNLGTFEPRHVGAMQAYLRQSVINRICDEVRRIGRQPPPLELPDDHPCDRNSPEEDAIRAEAYDHYREALSGMTPKDRALIVARIEMQWSLAEIAHRYGMPTVDAARMAVTRAVKRLSADFAARRK
jgi:RNA polymerase sigma-70 factor (ECF subfamily)